MRNKITANYSKEDNNMASLFRKELDAGYDMFTLKTTIIFPFIPKKIKLNFKAEIPRDHFGLVTGRSGESLKGNFVIPGIIDCTFRGIMSAITVRIGLFPRIIRKGTRIAQLLILEHKDVEWILATKLTDTSRGEKSFGSSGKR